MKLGANILLQRLKNWIFETRIYASEKNGEIVCRRVLGRWGVYVQSIDQTSPYITRMWRGALERVPRGATIRRALLLGVAAGGWITIVRKRFPNAHITAVEHDPVMARIFNKHATARAHAVRCVTDDAGHALRDLRETYDLILIDLFKGPNPSPLLSNSAFLARLQEKLSSHGYLIVNVFRDTHRFAGLQKYFSCWGKWKIRENHLALFRHFGLGQEGDPLPNGFVHPKQSRAFLRGSLMRGFKYSLVGENDRLGIRFRRGPFLCETYASDTEPESRDASAPVIILWHRITRTDVPPGWHRLPATFDLVRKTGYAEISRPAYWENWTAHAKRHRAHWLSQSDVEITEIGSSDYLEAYTGARQHSEARQIALEKIAQNLAVKNHLRFFGAREVTSKKIVAGLCILDLPELSQSVHTAAFILDEAKATPVGTGLIDHWFQECLRQKIRFLNFGSFWSRGNPSSWKGFSRFKSQFGVKFIRYPRVLFKIALRKKG